MTGGRPEPSAVISRAELERRLRLDDVDGAELSELITRRFRSARHETDRSSRVPYDGPAALLLHYSGSGRLTGIEPGPALTEETVAELELQAGELLLAAAVPRVARMVLFAPQPVVGYWRHRDLAVIRQVPDGLPQAPFAMAEHPLLLEVAYQGAEDGFLDAHRSHRVPRQLALVLTLLLPHLTLPSHHRGRKEWALLPPMSRETLAGPGPAEISTGYVELGYGLGEFDRRADAFTARDAAPDLPVEDTPTYYTGDGDWRLPTSLHDDLDHFTALEPERQRLLLRAAFWLHHAQVTRHHSMSAAYTAAVQSVEVLVDGAQALPPTKAFKEFVDRYAPADRAGAGAERRDLYRVRSNLTHGSRLFLSDSETGWFGTGPPQAYEYRQLAEAMRVCRTAVVNWLRHHGSTGRA